MTHGLAYLQESRQWKQEQMQETPHPLRKRQVPVLVQQVVPALHDDEHVVYPDTWNIQVITD